MERPKDVQHIYSPFRNATQLNTSLRKPVGLIAKENYTPAVETSNPYRRFDSSSISNTVAQFKHDQYERKEPLFEERHSMNSIEKVVGRSSLVYY